MSDSYDAAMATAAANTTKETVGAQIVTKTLDTLNKTAPAKGRKSKSGGDMAASYDFNKSVLSAAYNPTGTIAEVKT